MIGRKYPYTYRIKLGNKVIYRGLDKRLINYLIAQHPQAKVKVGS